MVSVLFGSITTVFVDVSTFLIQSVRPVIVEAAGNATDCPAEAASQNTTLSVLVTVTEAEDAVRCARPRLDAASVLPLTTNAPVEPVLTARAVATPVPKPEMPVATGRPVAFVSVAADGVPRLGVVKAGELANTSAPVPVSSVTAVAKLALEGVARNAATPVPKPEMPVATGNPVALVKVTAEGVPRFGVIRVGDDDITTFPDPVIAYSPRTPALLYKTRPLAPLATAELPTVNVLAPPPVALKTPPLRDSPAPTLISSTAPVLAVLRPRMRAVVIVRPLVVIAPCAINVPDVGRVTLVEPLVVKVRAFAPLVVKFAASVRLPLRLTVRLPALGLYVSVKSLDVFSVVLIVIR